MVFDKLEITHILYLRSIAFTGKTLCNAADTHEFDAYFRARVTAFECFVISETLLRLNFVIFSDSLLSLMAIHKHHFETRYVQKFISDYSQLVNSGKTIALCWIPSHVHIQGNEHADHAAAKSVLSSTISILC